MNRGRAGRQRPRGEATLPNSGARARAPGGPAGNTRGTVCHLQERYSRRSSHV